MGRGAQTHPSFIARQQYDFEAERARCLNFIDRIASRDVNGAWLVHPIFRSMTGGEVSRLQAKHLNHHLKQFGV